MTDSDHSDAALLELSQDIFNRLESLIFEAEGKNVPLEIEPTRSRLFELFVSAEGAGLLDEDSPVDMSADGLCHQLAERWGLAEAAQKSVVQNAQLGGENLSRMRMLWSVMRMWMEWDYAWSRWDEFH